MLCMMCVKYVDVPFVKCVLDSKTKLYSEEKVLVASRTFSTTQKYMKKK